MKLVLQNDDGTNGSVYGYEVMFLSMSDPMIISCANLSVLVHGRLQLCKHCVNRKLCNLSRSFLWHHRNGQFEYS
jgi:hypothetical protein